MSPNNYHVGTPFSLNFLCGNAVPMRSRPTMLKGAFTELQGVIDHLIENCFPEQTVTMNYKNKHPWLTPKLKASIKKRNSMSNICKQNPDNMDLHNKYKSYRNRVTSKTRNAQLQYHSNEIDIVKNDVSKSWNVLKMIIGLGTTKRNSNTSFIINDDILSDSNNIANAFNNYFVSIGAELSDSISSNAGYVIYIFCASHKWLTYIFYVSHLAHHMIFITFIIFKINKA